MAVKKAKKKAAKVSAKEIAVGTTTERYQDVKFATARMHRGSVSPKPLPLTHADYAENQAQP